MSKGSVHVMCNDNSTAIEITEYQNFKRVLISVSPDDD